MYADTAEDAGNDAIWLKANWYKVTVWNEFRHEKSEEAVKKVYPEGMHAVIAAHQEVSDEIISRVQERVLEWMGLVVLYSGHHSNTNLTSN